MENSELNITNELTNTQIFDSFIFLTEKIKNIESKLIKKEDKKHFFEFNTKKIIELNSANTYGPSNFFCKKRKYSNDTNCNYDNYNDQNDRHLSRENNLIVFGVDDNSKDDLSSIINIFFAIGINHNNEIQLVERLKFKRCQKGPLPILVILKGLKLKPNEILKAAKAMKSVDELKHISISADLSVTQRMVMKQLVRTRVELNKQLREKIPEADFYYSIKHNRIVKLKKIKDRNEQVDLNKWSEINIEQMIQYEIKKQIENGNLLKINEAKTITKANNKILNDSDYTQRLVDMETNQIKLSDSITILTDFSNRLINSISESNSKLSKIIFETNKKPTELFSEINNKTAIRLADRFIAINHQAFEQSTELITKNKEMLLKPIMFCFETILENRRLGNMKIEDEFVEKVLNIKLNAKVTTSTPNIKEDKLESNTSQNIL